MRGFVLGLIGLAGLAAVPGVARAQDWRGYPDGYGYGYGYRHEYARPVFAPYAGYYAYPRRRAFYPMPEVVFAPPPFMIEPPVVVEEARPVLRNPVVRRVVRARPAARASCTCPLPVSARTVVPVVPETPHLPVLRPAPEHEVFPPAP